MSVSAPATIATQLAEQLEALRGRRILAVVGSREFENRNAYALALPLIAAAVEVLDPHQILSGGADGMDTYAGAFALMMGVPFQEFLPRQQIWKPHGYEERNIKIAESCTHLLAIRCYESKTFGSGWTANRAQELGRVVQRVTIPAAGRIVTVEGHWK